MFEEQLKEKIEISKKICDDLELEEPYKSICFRVILERLLAEGEVIYKSKTMEKKEETSLINFLKQKNISNHADRVVAMAYFMYKYKNVEIFNSADIKNLYSEAMVKEPKNIVDIINKREEKGYLMEKGEKDGLKAWSITMDGIEYTESLE
jgi:hypothetical protein